MCLFTGVNEQDTAEPQPGRVPTASGEMVTIGLGWFDDNSERERHRMPAVHYRSLDGSRPIDRQKRGLW